MQERYAVRKLEVDVMVVDAEESIDLYSLKSKELSLTHGVAGTGCERQSL